MIIRSFVLPPVPARLFLVVWLVGLVVGLCFGEVNGLGDTKYNFRLQFVQINSSSDAKIMERCDSSIIPHSHF